MKLINRRPILKAVEVPPVQFQKLSKPSLCLLKIQKVRRISEGHIQGHGTDMNEYYTVDDGLILQKAGELRAEGLNPEEIVTRESVVSLGTVGSNQVKSRAKMTHRDGNSNRHFHHREGEMVGLVPEEEIPIQYSRRTIDFYRV